MEQNYPNPFNPSTKISFSLATRSDVKLDVYNMLGEKVATLVNCELVAGRHSYDYDASHLSSGVYIYKLQADKFSIVKKMMLLK